MASSYIMPGRFFIPKRDTRDQYFKHVEFINSHQAGPTTYPGFKEFKFHTDGLAPPDFLHHSFYQRNIE